MSITRIKRMAPMTLQLDGGVPGVVGWEIVRDECGCRLWIAMRLDKNEPVIGLQSCDDHETECGRALLAMQAMPPLDTEIGELWERLLEEEIG